MSRESLHDRVMADVREHVRPEFLNRIDEVVDFDRLGAEQLREIVGIQLDRLRARLAQRELTLEFTDVAMEHLAELGYAPLYGASPLKRVIRKYLEEQLAKPMLTGKLGDRRPIVVQATSDGSLRFMGSSQSVGP